jgi:hypothetical protein
MAVGRIAIIGYIETIAATDNNVNTLMDAALDSGATLPILSDLD